MTSKQTIAGYLYVLSHPSDKNLFKVGVTRRKALIRLAEHNTQLEKVFTNKLIIKLNAMD